MNDHENAAPSPTSPNPCSFFGSLLALALLGCTGCDSGSPPPLPADPQIQAIVHSGKPPTEIRRLVMQKLSGRDIPDLPAASNAAKKKTGRDR